MSSCSLRTGWPRRATPTASPRKVAKSSSPGQIGWNAQAKLVGDDLVAQVEQVLSNIVQVLDEAGGAPRHLVRMTWYLTSKSEYCARQREIGQAYRRVIGRHFPAMTAFVVSGLIEDGAKIEIEATAIIPPSSIDS